MLVMAVFLVPLSVTVTPTKGSPFESVTCPLTVFFCCVALSEYVISVFESVAEGAAKAPAGDSNPVRRHMHAAFWIEPEWPLVHRLIRLRLYVTILMLGFIK